MVRYEDIRVIDRKPDKQHHISRLERLVAVKVLQSDRFAFYALMRMYSLMTENEKKFGVATVKDGKGPNKTDAKLFADVAKRLVKTRTMSQSQLDVVRRRLLKYRGQLVEHFVTKHTPTQITSMLNQLKIY